MTFQSAWLALCGAVYEAGDKTTGQQMKRFLRVSVQKPSIDETYQENYNYQCFWSSGRAEYKYIHKTFSTEISSE